MKDESRVDKRTKLIIKYRKMKIRRKEENENDTTYYLSKGNKKFVLQCIPNVRTIGIKYVRELNETIENTESDSGIIVADGKYTYSAKANAPKLKVELIPPTLPTFDFFKHKLVSPAEVLDAEEKEGVLSLYHAKPYQFPRIKFQDPVSIILGAKRGDIIRFTSESETSGKYVSFRYVV
jgi:DNA-directed RNA polymerase I, II, and III subunit RPABC1